MTEGAPRDRRSPRRSPRTRRLLAGAAVAAAALGLLTIRHVPTPFSDLQLYASIARARQLFGVGVPTISWNSPVAVDHIAFYGPVWFDLCATTLQLFGVTLLAFRLTSVIGMAMLVAAAALLTHELSNDRDRWLWTIALILVSPDGGAGMATGVMHTLAVALSMLALAVFIRGLRFASGVAHGAAAGVLLAMAAMTTPRAYLFVAAFFGSMALLPLTGHRLHKGAWRMCAAAAVGLCVPMLIWIVISHGSPVRWARYMMYIFSHEDTDVAILPTAIREYSFSWTPALTPLVALIGGLMAARGIVLERRRPPAGTSASAFALIVTFLTYVVTVVILNYTFSNGEYFALPLFVVVLAMPARAFGVKERTLAAAVAVLIVCDVGLLTLKSARTAATWSASDPDPLNDFVLAHVPPGSAVVGPEAPYFFPVERAGSRYRTVSARSWADWARWVPIVEPESVRHAARLHEDPPTARFFIWPNEDDDAWPDGYECARGHVVGAFRPAPTYLHLLGRFGHPTDQGYPASTLYRLPPGCPVGYDPTVGH